MKKGNFNSTGLSSQVKLTAAEEGHRDIIKCWDQKALQWKLLVGDSGDANRIFNSDPVLWKFLGPVKGQNVLDAGCGTGYLSVKLAEKGAQVIASDISEAMLEEARALASRKNVRVDFRHESSSRMDSLKDESQDAIVSNYVLMDLPDLQAAVDSFFRVLKKGGRVVVIVTHPGSTELESKEMYFDEIKKKDRWGTFDSDFIYFHRPIRQYWQAFRKAGFIITEMDEPVAEDPTKPGFKEEWIKTYRKRPWSLAFLLHKN